MQKITTQTETEQWTSDASESTQTIHGSTSIPQVKVSQHKKNSISTKQETERAGVIVLGLFGLFNCLGIIWLFLNTPFRLDAIYYEGFTLRGCLELVMLATVQLMAMASARAAAPIVDRWLTAREQRRKKSEN